MKIELEIGENLRQAIEMIVNHSYLDRIGGNLKEAFGIDFSKAIESNWGEERRKIKVENKRGKIIAKKK